MGHRRRKRATSRNAETPRLRVRRWPAITFLVVVFAAKLTVAVQLDQHPLLAPDSGLDTAAHLALARRVLAGDLWLGPGLYYLSPLYTYFLAAALRIQDSLLFVRGLQAALGAVAVGCVMVTAREWFGVRAGWIAGAITALTGEFTFYEILVQQSSLDTFLTASALLLFTFALTREARATLFGAATGMFWGLSLLNRPNVGLAAAAVVLVLFAARRWRLAVAISLGVCCCLAPVVARNAIVARQFALMSSQGGLNFYIGNNASATGQYVTVPGVRSNIEGQSEDTRHVASQALGREVNDSEASAYFSAIAFRWIRSDPLGAARLFFKKTLLVFNWRHQWLDYSYPYYAHDVDSLLRVLVVGPWLIVPLGLTGLLLLGRPARRPLFGLWAVFVPAYAAAVAVFFVAERYRLPLLIALCVPAGAVVDRLLAFRQQRLPAVGLAAATAVACLVTFWPLHLETGQFQERLRLSKVLMNRGDADGAARELEAAHALRPGDLVTEFNLGVALASNGRVPEGITHMSHAVDGGVDVPGARYALAGAVLTTGDRTRAAALVRNLTPDPGDDADSCYHVALLAINAGEVGAARRFLGRALQLRPGWPDAERVLAQVR